MVPTSARALYSDFRYLKVREHHIHRTGRVSNCRSMYDRLDSDYRVRGEEERKSPSDWGTRCFWYFGTLVRTRYLCSCVPDVYVLAYRSCSIYHTVHTYDPPVKDDDDRIGSPIFASSTPAPQHGIILFLLLHLHFSSIILIRKIRSLDRENENGNGTEHE